MVVGWIVARQWDDSGHEPPSTIHQPVWDLVIGILDSSERQKSKAQLTFISLAFRISVGRSHAVVGRT